jgi:hypothetical protein
MVRKYDLYSYGGAALVSNTSHTLLDFASRDTSRPGLDISECRAAIMPAPAAAQRL